LEYFLKRYFFFADFFFFFLAGILYHLQSLFHAWEFSRPQKKSNSGVRVRFFEGGPTRRFNRLRPKP